MIKKMMGLLMLCCFVCLSTLVMAEGESFGTVSGGEAMLYTLKNDNGMSVSVTNYGASLVRVLVPDKEGTLTDVVLGYDDAAGYEMGDASIGGTVGRVANRIAGAAFELNGKTYALYANEKKNTLHSGKDFYVKRLWQVKAVSENAVVFHLDSPDGDQGYPGDLSIDVTYRLSADNALYITYDAASDADTVFAPTNHSYFNLNGGGDVRGQLIRLDAEAVTEIDAEQIPTGEMISVDGTDFDFRKECAIQAARNGDYDHNFALSGEGFREVAALRSEETGITMTVMTDMPGLQLYTAANLNTTGKNGAAYPPYSAVCFETQFFPDAIHHQNFVQPILKAGEAFRSETAYQFSN